MFILLLAFTLIDAVRGVEHGGVMGAAPGDASCPEGLDRSNERDHCCDQWPQSLQAT